MCARAPPRGVRPEVPLSIGPEVPFHWFMFRPVKWRMHACLLIAALRHVAPLRVRFRR
jgi:hypothetical protein